MEQIFFGGWSSLIRTLVVGVLAYVVLVVFLRISGNRTLSKLNAFDLIVTVALGSTLATVLLSKSVPLADGILAFALLIGLQLVVTFTSVRKRWFRRILTGEPQLLLYRGEFMPAALRKARVTEDEVRSAVRSSGVPALEDVEAVVLETDGSLSVVQRSPQSGSSSLEGVQGQPANPKQPGS
ncbi:MAG TPA: YetF domain-containing protein [Marinobacter sp.]